MFGWSTRCIRWLGIVLVAAIAADARAQGPGSNAKVITWTPPASSEIYVGIMGEIAKPGVYRLDVQSLTLQSVIRRAGGLLEEASGTIRIVRQDRISESVFFTPNFNGPLLAGDLLVVESKRTQAAISRFYDADPQTRATSAREAETAIKSSSKNGVQMAFVNVLDRPVVVLIKHEDARLDHVVQKLDQSVELAHAVRVIGPERMLSQTAAPHPIHASLSDGSVLIFPRNAINRSKLPSLPLPYDSRIAAGALPSLIGGPLGQSAELRNVGQLPPLMARDSQNSVQYAQPPASLDQATVPSQPVFNSMSPSTPGRSHVPPPSNQTPAVSTNPRIATIPFSGERRITSSSSQLSTVDDDPRLPAAPEKGNTNLKENRSQTSQSDEPLDDEEMPAAQAGKNTSFSLAHMFGIAACVGLLIGLALLTRRHLDRQFVAVPGEIAEITAALYEQAAATDLTEESGDGSQESGVRGQGSGDRSQESGIRGQELGEIATPDIAPAALWFDQLLGNQLPIREEMADFPQQIALQGRIVPPPVYRVDPEIPRPLAQGPHFAIAGRSDQDDSAAGSVAIPEEEQVIEDFDGPHGSSPSKPHFMRRRAGDNTVAAAASGKVKAGQPAETETRHSVTPVADALRHLQGGQL